MDKNDKTAGLNKLMKECSPEEMQARLMSAAQVSKILKETPDAERLIRREKSAFTGTFLPDPGQRRQPRSSEKVCGLTQDTIIDRYRLVCDISRAADGSLWLVKDRDIEGPTMVLRILNGDDLTARERRRQEGESRIISQLRHPGCARLISFGSTDEGMVYRVSEFVPGTPIAAFCDDATLSIADRVSLFIQTCDIISDIHSQGPAGLGLSSADLIAEAEGGEYVVRVVDFGVSGAAVTGTTHGQATVSSDIRALGLVLLQLLTGLSPEECTAAAARPIPPRPTQLLRKRCFAVPSVAHKRGAEPAEVIKSVSGILDTAVMKCLGLEPNNEYFSVKDFARDVRKFLEQPDPLEDSWIVRLTGRRKRPE